jgi:hypothetical protein
VCGWIPEELKQLSPPIILAIIIDIIIAIFGSSIQEICYSGEQEIYPDRICEMLFQRDLVRIIEIIYLLFPA